MYQSLVLENKTKYYSDFLQDTIWNLLDTTYVIPNSFDFRLYRVSEEKYIARPDLISLDFYGDPMYADVICKLNGIGNPFELNIGMLIALPSYDSVQSFITKPSIKDLDNGLKQDAMVKPSPKSKNSKRRPNEAIVGDKRFKIDPTKGIIMY